MNRPFVRSALLLCYASALALGATARAAEPDTQNGAIPTITVIGTMPLPGHELDESRVAAPVQVATAADIDASHALDLTAYMNRRLGSVYVNDIQNNPLQPDINYRGYTASPLLGTPQGLSVYMDGVRLNQPFGDVVSWDLIPRATIASVTLIPGSNPLFGRNTLGGALSVRTKDGFSDPGTDVRLSYGSNDRAQIEFETGDHADSGLYWYASGNYLQDDGWRDASPTDASQLLGKLGWRDADTDISVTAAFADTDLTGNGFQEQNFLARDYASVYTKPDNTQNDSHLLNIALRHTLNERLSFSGNVYSRDLHTSTLNGDINDDSLEENVYQPNAAEQAALTAAGYTGFPTSGENASNTPFPSWRCIANILLNTEPNEKCNGLNNRTHTGQSNSGLSGQLTWSFDHGGRKNELTVGAAYDKSRTHFTQSSQFGYLTPDRAVETVEGPGAFADGTQDSENAFDARVDLTGTAHTTSVFASDSLDLGPAVTLTLSGRYDRTEIENTDAITPEDEPGTLTGEHAFSRFNPAFGITFAPSAKFGAYFGYNEGSRAPSSIELGCADPENPCRLPNSMAGDPPLDQVVTKTVEAGFRGRSGAGVGWNAGVFRADNHNDIMFVADQQDGFGYFKNFGQTRRQGVELGIDSRIGKFDVGANYTWLDATYRSDEIVNGEGNSTNDGAAPGFEGNIEVHPGDHIPLTPQNLFKAYAQWQVARKVSIDMDVLYVSGSYARGNENNEHVPDGVYYLGPGKTPGYTVFNLGAELTPTEHVRVFAQIDNVFEEQYYTGSLLAATGFTNTGSFIARPFPTPVIDGERALRHATFYAPGAPRTLWFGASYAFGATRR
ncbi:MAG TPA: TonB-dependent receptor [Gammaproteobacteria bacterium]|nr:TonB-dependent receptor [Gammaproteobacteria bacterium]